MLPRILLHIYGPFCIQSYGLMIVLGILVGTYFLLRDQRCKRIIQRDLLLHLMSISIIVGIAGGRLLHIFSCMDDYTTTASMLALHEGGLSILGTVLALLVFLPWYLRNIDVPVIPLLDLFSTYAPLAHAIARLGCLFAGCCHGIPSSCNWAITYTDSDTLAPLGVALHPTQLYSSLTFTLIFFVMLYCKRHPGYTGRDTLIFLTLFSFQRFIIDFWRGDRIFSSFALSYTISFHQWIALGLGIISLLVLIVCAYRTNRKAEP